YAVYAEERALGNLASADHASRLLQDPLDETGLILNASRGDDVVGTVRLNTSERTRFSEEFRLTYRADAFEARAPGAVSYSGRLVVRKDQRRSSVFQALVNAHYRQALDRGVQYMLWNCTPALVGLYERLGGRRYAPNFVDKDMGYRVPMVVLARDAAHFKRVRSPWGRILAAMPQKPAPPPQY